MQKVEGSSPFIRFTEPAGNGDFSMGANRCGGRSRCVSQVLVRSEGRRCDSSRRVHCRHLPSRARCGARHPADVPGPIWRESRGSIQRRRIVPVLSPRREERCTACA
jgi:hypothetical protein